MLFSEMTLTQKMNAIEEGNRLKYIGQGNFETCTILQDDFIEIEVEWESGDKEWISIKSLGSTWKLLNVKQK